MMGTLQKLCLLSALSLAGCAVGPNYTPPTPDVPARFQDAQTPPAANNQAAPAFQYATGSNPDPTWWREFNDPTLDSLEDRVMSDNFDLRTGLLKIIQARLQVQTARAQGLPSLTGSASYEREQLGARGILKAEGVGGGAAGGAAGAGGGAAAGAGIESALINGLTKDVNLYQVGFDATWELDLFGKVRRSVEQAEAQAEEQVQSRNDMLVSLQAEVATNYFQLRAAQTEIGVTEVLIKSDQDILDLTLNRQQHGLQGAADVESARAQVANLQSQLPQFEQQAATSRHAIAVLLAQAPEALEQELSASAPLPSLPHLIAVGVPSELARRRPDVRQAEAGIRAATAEVGVAIASLYPDVSLSGMFGLRNISTNYLFDWASRFYSAGPTISFPIYKGGSLIANIKISRADQATAILSYRKTVLTALQNVEDALVSLDSDQRRVTATQATVDADQHAVDINQHSFEKGLANYITVLNSQVQRDQARLQLAQVTATQLTDLVSLYKALAGGWNAPGANPVASNAE